MKTVKTHRGGGQDSESTEKYLVFRNYYVIQEEILSNVDSKRLHRGWVN